VDWLNTSAGFLVGLLVGFTGVGGGALMTPLLVLVFGVAPQTAVGTDLLYAALTKSVGSWVHGLRGAVDWLVLRRLWIGSLPMATLTLIWLQRSPESNGLAKLIVPLLGIALVLTGLAMFARPAFQRLGEKLRTNFPERFKAYQPALTVFAGAVLGFLVTLTSVGAGAMGAVMLVYLYPRRLKAQKIVGTDIAHAIPLTLVAGLGHAKLGHVDLGLLGALLLGSIPGIAIGSMLSHRVSGKAVRSGIAIMLLVIGGKMLASSF
jgi:uncharacterized membrane protein YfcA